MFEELGREFCGEGECCDVRSGEGDDACSKPCAGECASSSAGFLKVVEGADGGSAVAVGAATSVMVSLSACAVLAIKTPSQMANFTTPNLTVPTPSFFHTVIHSRHSLHFPSAVKPFTSLVVVVAPAHVPHARLFVELLISY